MGVHFKKNLFLFIIPLIIFYLFWGPFFPWNPIKSGYKKISSPKAVIFIQDYKGEIIETILRDLIHEEETFHDLQFRKKFRIVILGGESNIKRYLPWLKGSGYSVKLGSVNVIYIGATARNSEYGIIVYLKHEMSHLLIHQNVLSAKNNMEILRQGWFAEGIATYFGGPKYYDKEQFKRLWKGNGMTFNNLYPANPHKMDKNIIYLNYTYYRLFVEFIIHTYGLEVLQSYLKSYIENPEAYLDIFNEVFSENINEILGKFNIYMNTQTFPFTETDN